ncbi:hypothetical protein [Phycicoccus sonneratiae]|uniref:Secretion/DNA translocation related CpaE-like protein n=1 Tax=Phycicoccus sonneratiae TaxID=2807628 RepID=A0ABS2CN93_9MICO|nr:hypothetical protein [Phycicoccus sonneraticus]MBM6401360.1 hypothetical protein [Phycicoccus sonneraticus]
MTTTPSVLAVVGASGGLGASTLALAVGRRLAGAGPPVTVVDLDLTGGGLDVTAGVEHLAGRRWSALASVHGALPPDLVLGSLPTEAGCRLLSAGGEPGVEVPPSAVADVLDSAVAGGPVVVDLPASSPHLPLVLRHAPLVVVLTGLRTRSLADADALVDRLGGGPHAGPSPPDLRLVTRGPRPSAGVLDDVVAHLGATHLQHLPDDPRVARDAERGAWPAGSGDAVRRCADRVVEVAVGPAPALGRAS